VKIIYRDIVFGIVLIFFFSALIVWFVLSNPASLLPAGVAIFTLLIGVVTFIQKTIKRRSDLLSGAPAEDEFTKSAKIHAGNQAFIYSMYLWLLIFLFNSSFAKNETMLGIGILGSGLIYGISLWHIKSTGEFNA